MVSFTQHPRSSEQQREQGPQEPWGKAGFRTLAVTVPQVYMWENTALCPACIQTCTHRHTRHRHTPDTDTQQTWTHNNGHTTDMDT